MRVAIAVMSDEKQRFLITQRPMSTTHAGFWEFPGGKIKDGERDEDALVREVKEEVDLDVQAYTFLGQISHHYSLLSVSLQIFHVHQYKGTAVCREAQMDLRWVLFDDLKQYPFPEANVNILKLIRKAGLVS